MKRIFVGATLLVLMTPAALAQTTSSSEPVKPLPPGFANGPETKWDGSDLPSGLSNDRAQRTWDTPPGWTNQNSQGWQNGGGPSSMGGPSSTAGQSSMAGGKGRGR